MDDSLLAFPTNPDSFQRHLLDVLGGDKKVSSYIAQYPILRIAQSALHFTSLTDLFQSDTM